MACASEGVSAQSILTEWCACPAARQAREQWGGVGQAGCPSPTLGQGAAASPQGSAQQPLQHAPAQPSTRPTQPQHSQRPPTVAAQQRPLSHVQQPQPAIQARGQHRRAIARHRHPRHCRPHVVRVNPPHADVKAPHSAVHAAADDLGVVHRQAGDAVLWSGQVRWRVVRRRRLARSRLPWGHPGGGSRQQPASVQGSRLADRAPTIPHSTSARGKPRITQRAQPASVASHHI
jgi:hypothetical protein